MAPRFLSRMSLVLAGLAPRFLSRMSLVLAGLALGAVAAQAQSPLNARAIPIDIEDGFVESSGEPLLIAAARAPNSAPFIAGGIGNAGRAAVVTEASLPRPSIIVGLVTPGEETQFGITALLPGSVTRLAFAHDDLEARAAMRARDPDLFNQLVREGHIDPPSTPEDALKRALQVELKRMNCYRSTIDGDWGRGSRRSVTSYFAEIPDANWQGGEEASPELFREILIRGDVECPTPVATPRTTTRPTGNTSSTRATTRTTTRTQTSTSSSPSSGGGGLSLRGARTGGTSR